MNNYCVYNLVVRNFRKTQTKQNLATCRQYNSFTLSKRIKFRMLDTIEY